MIRKIFLFFVSFVGCVATAQEPQKIGAYYDFYTLNHWVSYDQYGTYGFGDTRQDAIVDCKQTYDARLDRLGVTNKQENTQPMTISQELEIAKERYIAAKQRAVDHAPELIIEICQRMSLRDLAKQIGKSPTYISQIATGKVECSDETYFSLWSAKLSQARSK